MIALSILPSLPENLIYHLPPKKDGNMRVFSKSVVTVKNFKKTLDKLPGISDNVSDRKKNQGYYYVQKN